MKKYKVNFYKDRFNIDPAYCEGDKDISLSVEFDEGLKLLEFLQMAFKVREGDSYSVWEDGKAVMSGAFDYGDIESFMDEFGGWSRDLSAEHAEEYEKIFSEKYGEKFAKYDSRDDMPSEVLKDFVNACFDVYEEVGFKPVFDGPYECLPDGLAENNGCSFKVVSRCTEDQCDLESLPMWNIKFANGYECQAYPEEICYAG